MKKSKEKKTQNKLDNEGIYQPPRVLLDRSKIKITSSKGKVIQCIIRDFVVNGKDGSWKFNVHRIKDDIKLFLVEFKGE